MRNHVEKLPVSQKIHFQIGDTQKHTISFYRSISYAIILVKLPDTTDKKYIFKYAFECCQTVSSKIQHGSQYINKYLDICYGVLNKAEIEIIGKVRLPNVFGSLKTDMGELDEPVIKPGNFKMLQHTMLPCLQIARIVFAFLAFKFHWTDNQSQRINRKPNIPTKATRPNANRLKIPTKKRLCVTVLSGCSI